MASSRLKVRASFILLLLAGLEINTVRGVRDQMNIFTDLQEGIHTETTIPQKDEDCLSPNHVGDGLSTFSCVDPQHCVFRQVTAAADWWYHKSCHLRLPYQKDLILLKRFADGVKFLIEHLDGFAAAPSVGGLVSLKAPVSEVAAIAGAAAIKPSGAPDHSLVEWAVEAFRKPPPPCEDKVYGCTRGSLSFFMEEMDQINLACNGCMGESFTLGRTSEASMQYRDGSSFEWTQKTLKSGVKKFSSSVPESVSAYFNLDSIFDVLLDPEKAASDVGGVEEVQRLFPGADTKQVQQALNEAQQGQGLRVDADELLEDDTVTGNTKGQLSVLQTSSFEVASVNGTELQETGMNEAAFWCVLLIGIALLVLTVGFGFPAFVWIIYLVGVALLCLILAYTPAPCKD